MNLCNEACALKHCFQSYDNLPTMSPPLVDRESKSPFKNVINGVDKAISNGSAFSGEICKNKIYYNLL